MEESSDRGQVVNNFLCEAGTNNQCIFSEKEEETGYWVCKADTCIKIEKEQKTII